jgi:hypothetical protein
MEQHTVEVTFEAEKVSELSDEHSTLKLYRTPEDTYFVYIDMRDSLGGQAELCDGHFPHGYSEGFARNFWPELFSNQSAK